MAKRLKRKGRSARMSAVFGEPTEGEPKMLHYLRTGTWRCDCGASMRDMTEDELAAWEEGQAQFEEISEGLKDGEEVTVETWICDTCGNRSMIQGGSFGTF